MLRLKEHKVRTELKVIDLPVARMFPVVELRPSVELEAMLRASSYQVKFRKRSKAARIQYNKYANKYYHANQQRRVEYRRGRYKQAKAEVTPAITELYSKIALAKKYITEYRKAIHKLRMSARRFH